MEEERYICEHPRCHALEDAKQYLVDAFETEGSEFRLLLDKVVEHSEPFLTIQDPADKAALILAELCENLYMAMIMPLMEERAERVDFHEHRN